MYYQGTDVERAAVITRRLPQRVATTQWEHDCDAADHLEAAWASVAEGLGVDRDPADVLINEWRGHFQAQLDDLNRPPVGTSALEVELRQQLTDLLRRVPPVHSLRDGTTQAPSAAATSPIMWLGVGATFWRVCRPPPPRGATSTHRSAGAAWGSQLPVIYGEDAATQTSLSSAVADASVSFEASSPMPLTLRELARERVLSICRALREQLRAFSAAPVGIPSVEARRSCEVAARLYGTAVLGVERLVGAWPEEPEAATIPLPPLSLAAVPLTSSGAPGPPSPWPAVMLAVEREDPMVDCGPLPWGNEVLRFTSPKLFVVDHLDDDGAGRTREATDAHIVGIFYGDWRLQVVPLVKKLFTKAEVAFDYQVLRNSTKRAGTMETALARCQRLGIEPIFRGPVSFGEVSASDVLASGEPEGEADESSEAESIESDPSSCSELGGRGAKRQREEAQAELDAVCEAWEREDPVVDRGPLPWGNEVLRFHYTSCPERGPHAAQTLRALSGGAGLPGLKRTTSPEGSQAHKRARPRLALASSEVTLSSLPSGVAPLLRASAGAPLPLITFRGTPYYSDRNSRPQSDAELALGVCPTCIAKDGQPSPPVSPLAPLPLPPDPLSPPLALPPSKFPKRLPPTQPSPSPRPPMVALPAQLSPPQPPACSLFSLMGLCIPPGLTDDTMRAAIASPRFSEFSLPPPSRPAPPVSSFDTQAGAGGAWADSAILSSDDGVASSEDEAFAATTPPVRHWVGGGNGRQFWRGASPPAQPPLRARANTSLLPCRPRAETSSTAAGAERLVTLLSLCRCDAPFAGR